MLLSWCGSAAGQSGPASLPASEPESKPITTTSASAPAGEGEETNAHTLLPPYNPPINPAPESGSGAIWQMFSSIIVILLLGGAALFVIKKVLPRLGISPAAAAAPGPRGRMKVIETLRLGPQRQVHLLEVEGKRYLVGHTASNITMLTEVSPAQPPKEESK